MNSYSYVEQIDRELLRLRKNREFRLSALNLVRALAVIAAVSILIASLWLPILRITGSGMEPTLFEREIVAAVRSTDLRRGDVAAFYYNNSILIKRVAAIGGDTVDVGEGDTLTVNGKPYYFGAATAELDIELPYKVPANSLFVIGDNGAASVDSRNSAVGAVSQEQLIGKVLLVIWPLSEFGPVR